MRGAINRVSNRLGRFRDIHLHLGVLGTFQHIARRGRSLGGGKRQRHLLVLAEPTLRVQQIEIAAKSVRLTLLEQLTTNTQVFRNNRDLLWMWLWTRAVLVFIACMSLYVIVPGQFHEVPASWWDYFFKWDSGWYSGIIQNGYYVSATGETNTGFFPLYPICVWLLSHFALPLNIAGILFSNACLIFGVIQLRKLLEIDYSGTSIPYHAAFFFLINPVTFFYSAFYTESLYFLVVVSFFYAVRKENWLWVGILGALASATRSAGILLVVPLAWEVAQWIKNQPNREWKVIWKPLLALCSVPLGLSAFAAWLWITVGNPLAFMQAQVNWGRTLTPFWVTLQNASHLNPFYAVFFCGAAALTLLLIVLAIRQRIRASYILFVSMGLCLSLSYKILEATPRYVSVLFPLYLVLAIWVENFPQRKEAIMIFALALMSLCWILFVNGYWMT